MSSLNKMTFDGTLATIGDSVGADGRTFEVRLAGKLWEMALDGNLDAARLILDRLDQRGPKPNQTHKSP